MHKVSLLIPGLLYFSQVAGGPNNMASTLKAARAALMLIPILGIHFLMMPIRYVDYVEDCCTYVHINADSRVEFHEIHFTGYGSL